MQEYLLGQTGLDVPVRNVTEAVKGVNNIRQTGNVIDNLLTGLRVATAGDVAKTKLNEQYKLVKDLENKMKQMKKEGIKIQTIKELEAESSKSNIDDLREQMRNLLAQY